ncbi:AT-hook motif nuclear-localized protein 10-like [Andrographis paniculata]|uniref:AT-hook motif nuclear-localized protein 10-like n=1 Tax=Andrographis paniculata TaxID=175694 RepID=UPI0021E96C47|nr:AT-hook motif nuclear-localized protein 10-like [Andrographis paniculata]
MAVGFSHNRTASANVTVGNFAELTAIAAGEKIAQTGGAGGTGDSMMTKEKTALQKNSKRTPAMSLEYSSLDVPPGFAPLPLPLPPLPQPIENPSGSNKRRGRPRGTDKRKTPDSDLSIVDSGALQESIWVGDMKARVVIVNPGEIGSYQVSVFSGSGTVSGVTLPVTGVYGNVMTFQGSFEIVGLSGTYTLSERQGIKCWAGRLAVLLARPDGTVIGGTVAGVFMAASPVRILVGSFERNNQQEPSTPCTTEALPRRRPRARARARTTAKAAGTAAALGYSSTTTTTNNTGYSTTTAAANEC